MDGSGRGLSPANLHSDLQTRTKMKAAVGEYANGLEKKFGAQGVQAGHCFRGSRRPARSPRTPAMTSGSPAPRCS